MRLTKDLLALLQHLSSLSLSLSLSHSFPETSLIALAHFALDPYDKSGQIACPMAVATINHTACQQDLCIDL